MSISVALTVVCLVIAMWFVAWAQKRLAVSREENVKLGEDVLKLILELNEETKAKAASNEKVARQAVDLGRMQSTILEGRAHDARMFRTCADIRRQLSDTRGELDKQKRMAALTTVDNKYEAMEKHWKDRERLLMSEARKLQEEVDLLRKAKRLVQSAALKNARMRAESLEVAVSSLREQLIAVGGHPSAELGWKRVPGTNRFEPVKKEKAAKAK